MQRLNYLDAQFLHLEDASSPMHIANIAVFEGPVPSRAEIERLFESKLHKLERYRQRVRFVPFDLGRPVWVDDPRFYLRYHVRRTALPAPHDYDALCSLMGRLMSQLLDRSRPLWEVWIVEGLQDGRWAMISKSHHCMVDGVSGTDLLSVILDKDPDAQLPEPEPWTPEPEPTRKELMRLGVQGMRDDMQTWGKARLVDAKNPREAVRAVRNIGKGLTELNRRLLKTPPQSLQGKVGQHRSYAPARASLGEIQTIRKKFGGTVNDVVLAAVAGGHRALLSNRGDDPNQTVIRSLIPVSTRGSAGQSVYGNRVSALLCDLPVHLADPVERLRAVSAEMNRLKASHMIEANAFLTTLGDLALPILVGPLTRLYVLVNHYLPQRAVATVTTNVPGPREPLYCLGRPMVESFPYVPITQGSRVGTAIISYDGQLGFGVTADYEAVPDTSVFVQAIEADIAEMVRRAGATPGADARRLAEVSSVQPIPTLVNAHSASPVVS